ncbi:formate dehydrogenase subunit gamma [Cupriavidus sp. TA19]|uniref:formate dehydrogenase subunit gamma n=1 Tax=unclassified Cupriavidus TaxID=2640874 RepID=UPI000E2F1335|nr:MULTISPECIES: formate dehydrogenase subunit gamma [unclassified Cupriavidus]BDB23254.1 formate dehydrogenase subunit gamma [Cupriavidus sp. P-10]GLC91377.1 formate dehydrogenase subunit gamma [Cupriavidus sp. TA19]
MPDIAPNAQASADAIDAIVAARQDMPGALLPILHEIQDTQGHIPDTAVPVIARALNLSRAEVHGVITFYHHFRQEPAGRHVIQVCRAEACQAVGAEALADHARRALGCGFHETTADGAVTLEPVYCLGQCACGPAVMVGEQLHGYVDAKRFDALVRSLREAQAANETAEVQA